MFYNNIDMLKETITKLETAKLANEVGFKDACSVWKGKHYYNHRGELDGDSTDYMFESINAKKENREVNLELNNISAPAQSLLQTWLRNNHGIEVYVIPIFKDKVGYDRFKHIGYRYNVIDFFKHDTLIDKSVVLSYHDFNVMYNKEDYDTTELFHIKIYDTYEDALEDGLILGLKMLKSTIKENEKK